jgi:hypothetical protein
MTNDLTGKTVIDANRREYSVERHVIEADELVLKRGDETHAITTMDIADDYFQVVE